MQLAAKYGVNPSPHYKRSSGSQSEKLTISSITDEVVDMEQVKKTGVSLERGGGEFVRHNWIYLGAALFAFTI